MPAVHRLGDMNTEGGVILSTTQGSVYVNGKLASTDGSVVSGHFPFIPPHVPTTKTANGSSTVFFEGLPVNRIGDADECGHPRAVGSPDVNVGG